jgi:hypothetical protein
LVFSRGANEKLFLLIELPAARFAEANTALPSESVTVNHPGALKSFHGPLKSTPAMTGGKLFGPGFVNPTPVNP